MSTEEIHSDLIGLGTADLIISMEPMEALRYLPFLRPDGWVVTSSHPFVNIPNYPDEKELLTELESLPHVSMLPIDDMAHDNHLPKSANVILLGMAAKQLEILSPAELRSAVGRVFASKGEDIVNANFMAFDLGVGENG